MSYFLEFNATPRMFDLDTQRHVTSRTYEAFCWEGRIRMMASSRAGFRSLRRWRIARQRPGRERGLRLLRHWGRRLKQLPRAQQPNRLMKLAARNRTRASIPRDHFYLSK